MCEEGNGPQQCGGVIVGIRDGLALFKSLRWTSLRGVVSELRILQ